MEKTCKKHNRFQGAVEGKNRKCYKGRNTICEKEGKYEKKRC